MELKLDPVFSGWRELLPVPIKQLCFLIKDTGISVTQCCNSS